MINHLQHNKGNESIRRKDLKTGQKADYLVKMLQLWPQNCFDMTNC